MTGRGICALGLALVVVGSCGIEDTGPIALDDRIVAEPGVTALHDVLINDRAPAGGSLVLESVLGGRGTVEVFDERRVEYTAPPTGDVDSFTYVAVSDDGVRVEASVDVTIGSRDSTTVAPTTTIGEETTASTTVPPGTTAPSTTEPRTPPRIDPAQLDFETVAIGETVTDSVTLIAGDDPWTPDFSEFDLAPDLVVDESCGELPAGTSCEVAVNWTPASPGAFDVTLRLRDDSPLRVFGEATLAEPAWIIPSAGQSVWFDLLLRGITVEIAPVTGADDYALDARLCGGSECGAPLLVDRVGDSTRFFVGSADPARLQADYDAIGDAGLQPTLELTTNAVAGDEVSTAATILVPLTRDAMTARLVRYEPETPPCGPVDLVTTIEVESFMLASADAFARFIRSDPDGDLIIRSQASRIAVGPNTVAFDIDGLALSFETLELEFDGVPRSATTVDGVADYDITSCID